MREFAYFGIHKDMKRLFPDSVDAGMGAYVALVHPNDDNAFSVYSGDDANAIKQHAENFATRIGASVIQVTKATKLSTDESAPKTDDNGDGDGDKKTNETGDSKTE